MADSYPYHANTANVKKFMDFIQTAGVPSKVTFQYLSSVGFKSSNDRAILTILKFIGFVDNSGIPSDMWRAYRNKGQSGQVIAAALRKAYATLFTTYPDAHRKDNEALRNFFSSHTSVGEGALGFMVRTFKTLADMGDFDTPLDNPELIPTSTETGDGHDSGTNGNAVVAARRMVSTTTSGMTVNINIQLQIPATDKPETYESFFAAMKKHLLS